MPKADTSLPLRERILDQSLAIIEQSGIEALSLRAVARDLGVSHQAPYKHFPSRDHVVAQLVARAYATFSGALREAVKGHDAHGRLAAMGVTYLDYAAKHPLHYRLMFETELPASKEHPDMLAQARNAFELLVQALTDLPERASAGRAQIEGEALFIWSSLHGAASLSRSPAMDTLSLIAGVRERHVQQTLEAISRALGLPAPKKAASSLQPPRP